jgi:hypothetical protein
MGELMVAWKPAMQRRMAKFRTNQGLRTTTVLGRTCSGHCPVKLQVTVIVGVRSEAGCIIALTDQYRKLYA